VVVCIDLLGYPRGSVVQLNAVDAIKKNLRRESDSLSDPTERHILDSCMPLSKRFFSIGLRSLQAPLAAQEYGQPVQILVIRDLDSAASFFHWNSDSA